MFDGLFRLQGEIALKSITLEIKAMGQKFKLVEIIKRDDRSNPSITSLNNNNRFNVHDLNGKFD